LIHSGKVLKDDDTIASCAIQENDFLVVMVTKPKKAAAPAAAAATPATPAPAAATDTKTPAPPFDAAAPTAPAAPARDEFPGGAVENLIAMGFPEAEVRHCLRAANGNPDIAVEFLTNGIPDGMEQAAALASGGAASSSPAAGSGGQPLQALRNHPQFDDLRRLVQSNPQMLQQVLTQIGQQQPELLQEINANQAQFLQMMNEPVESAAPGPSGGSPGGAGAGAEGGFPAGMMEGIGNPAQMAQMIQSMSPEELNQMAAMMGLSPDQLRTTAQMIGQMPPEQLSQFMMQAMGGGGAEGMAGMMGGGGGGGGGQQVLRLTEEEMAAVDRLAEMGFDRSEAAQAFLACDKNEALAANLLMDGGFGFGADDSGNGGNNNGEGDNDGDDMYD
jgi:UV excision repair protein RAD23